MYVCVCNGVTDHDIRKAVGQGVHTLEELRDKLKVASCCGRCEDCARKTLHASIAEHCLGDHKQDRSAA